MNDEKIEHFRTSPFNQVRFEITSIPGNRNYKNAIFRKRSDRLYKIKLVGRDETVLDYAPNYSDIYRLVELLLTNIILDDIFYKETNALMNLFKQIETSRRFNEQKKL